MKNNTKLMYKLSLFLIACMASATLTSGQKQNNFWYFGTNGGFDFNTGAPVEIFNNQMVTLEGAASVSDCNGKFLFCSDGFAVFDANFDTMPNGHDMMGHNLSTQSALIVPKPGSNKIYYLFTTDAIEHFAVNGLRYSVIDMTLNGGLGDVVAGEKNILLHAPMTEKLTAFQDSASQNIWIVGHEWLTDDFFAYKLDSTNGLNTVAVESHIGVVHAGGQDNQNAKGYMKISRDGSKLALAINEMDRIELFDFNKSTGEVSNYVPITNVYTEVFGIEFSPDASRLYVTCLVPQRLYQLNLLAGSPAAIIASSTLISTSSAFNLGALQTAPDGKIYASRAFLTRMGVINNPNALGTACNYDDVMGPFMVNGNCDFGLPNQIKLYIPPWINSLGVEETFKPADFSIYPNPSSDGIFTISCLNSNATSTVRINVFDVLGHEVYSQSEKLSGNLNQKINLHGLTAGIYQVVLQKGEYKTNRKILITP